nr:hypothetical protein Q903MT_gene1938 [Picea sitchensis]
MSVAIISIASQEYGFFLTLMSSCCIMVGLFDDCLDLPFLDAWTVIIRYSVGWFR